MNKADLVELAAQRADISKASAARVVDAFLEGICAEIKRGESVTLVGFGSFFVAQRKARVGHNPKTLTRIQIEAANIPKFKAGKGLKDMVN